LTSIDIEGKEHGKDESSRCSNQCLKLQYVCELIKNEMCKLFGLNRSVDLNVKHEMTCWAHLSSLQRKLTHQLSYIRLFNFFHLSLFHVNVICKK
jgi:hypothetical protein